MEFFARDVDSDHITSRCEEHADDRVVITSAKHVPSRKCKASIADQKRSAKDTLHWPFYTSPFRDGEREHEVAYDVRRLTECRRRCFVHLSVAWVASEFSRIDRYHLDADGAMDGLRGPFRSYQFVRLSNDGAGHMYGVDARDTRLATLVNREL